MRPAGHAVEVCRVQVAEKHGSLKVAVYEGLKWHHRQAREDSRLNKKRPSTRNKAAVSPSPSSPCFVLKSQL